jgi:hypothetical protein
MILSLFLVIGFWELLSQSRFDLIWMANNVDLGCFPFLGI